MFASYNYKYPDISYKALIIGNPFLAGHLLVRDYASIWPGVSARADVDRIEIGEYTNIQDNSTLHCDHGNPLIIEDYVTVGHGVTLHGCRVENNCLIGIGAIVLSGAVIEENVILGAGSLVPENKVLEKGKVYFGSPARPIRNITTEEVEKIRKSAIKYLNYAKSYLKES
ncbi:MAG: gamma carbonic anhydrase family protein [Vulcanimicrobiota bacterium]